MRCAAPEFNVMNCLIAAGTDISDNRDWSKIDMWQKNSVQVTHQLVVCLKPLQVGEVWTTRERLNARHQLDPDYCKCSTVSTMSPRICHSRQGLFKSVYQVFLYSYRSTSCICQVPICSLKSADHDWKERRSFYVSPATGTITAPSSEWDTAQGRASLWIIIGGVPINGATSNPQMERHARSEGRNCLSNCWSTTQPPPTSAP